jgi:hypothetical protein
MPKPMIKIRAVVTCVEYHDLLEITLPWNLHHFDRVLVVTSKTERKTIRLAKATRKTDLFLTEAFRRKGSHFNKGAALEQAFHFLEREGWFCLLDADTLLPKGADLTQIGNRLIAPSVLYLAQRRLCLEPKDWSPKADWSQWPISEELLYRGGCFQLFHANDPSLAQRPWYPIDWNHAGQSPVEFIKKWPVERRQYYPWQVLHLGRPSENWFGRATPFLDGTQPGGAKWRRQRMAKLDADRLRCGFAGEKV